MLLQATVCLCTYVPGTPTDIRSGFSSVLRFPTVSVFPHTTLFIRRPSGHACSLETPTARKRNFTLVSDWEGLAPCRRRSSQLSAWHNAGKFRNERQDYNANTKVSLFLFTTAIWHQQMAPCFLQVNKTGKTVSVNTDAFTALFVALRRTLRGARTVMQREACKVLCKQRGTFQNFAKYELTQSSRALIQKPMMARLLKMVFPPPKLEDSSPCTQNLETGPYPDMNPVYTLSCHAPSRSILILSSYLRWDTEGNIFATSGFLIWNFPCILRAPKVLQPLHLTTPIMPRMEQACPKCSWHTRYCSRAARTKKKIIRRILHRVNWCAIFQAQT